MWLLKVDSASFFCSPKNEGWPGRVAPVVVERVRER